MEINSYSGPLTMALSPDAGEREVGLPARTASSVSLAWHSQESASFVVARCAETVFV